MSNKEWPLSERHIDNVGREGEGGYYHMLAEINLKEAKLEREIANIREQRRELINRYSLNKAQ